MHGSSFRRISGSALISANQTTKTGRAILVCYISATLSTNTSSRYIPIYMCLDFRYNEFLLQRAMVRKLKISSQTLLDVARELLTTTLNLVEQAPNIANCWCDVPWIVRQGLLVFRKSIDLHKDCQVWPSNRRRARPRASETV